MAAPFTGSRPCPRFPRWSVCTLVWPARGAARLVTIFSRHLHDHRGRFTKRWNENSSDTETDAHGAEAGTDYIQCETERPQCVQQTNMQPAYYMQEGCNRLRTSLELPQWNPLASLVTLCTLLHCELPR